MAYYSRNSRQNGPICSHRRICSCSTIPRTLHRSGICSVDKKVCNLWWSRTNEQTCNCECPGSLRSRPNLENSLWVLAELKKFSNVLWEIKFFFLILSCFFWHACDDLCNKLLHIFILSFLLLYENLNIFYNDLIYVIFYFWKYLVSLLKFILFLYSSSKYYYYILYIILRNILQYSMPKLKFNISFIR